METLETLETSCLHPGSKAPQGFGDYGDIGDNFSKQRIFFDEEVF